MSWRCTGQTNAELVNNLFRNGLIKSERVRNAFNAVDRGHFSKAEPYSDAPQRIGCDATISGVAPHMHAYAAESLLPRLNPGARVLDIGSGSGYLCALFGHLVGPTGKVIGVEHIPQLVQMSEQNLRRDPLHSQMLDEGRIKMVKADGREGYPEEGPYDAIHVGAAAAGMPEKLIEQLAAPGKMFVPVSEGYNQYIYEVEKDAEGNVKKNRSHGVMYVPLTDAREYSSS
ncbi:protein-L-isoaspartate O-methyltransferase [Sphaerosporella brunnea]|uniref:Protein-L-isoaspartate O-methyltransferase n=1 Tax=Sphaerosporella brunnea TaxID=1250544 RepID=A0A5J5EHU3_9PEZI|nr:protein-L-isoaspartate O-methyltransferase [Sphaerosporella brunnea]